MISFMKEILHWIFDIDGKRSEEVLELSITGEPLIKVSSSPGLRVYKTDLGRKGAMVAAEITQFGRNTDLLKRVICGDYDNALSQKTKDMLIARIKQRADDNGKYLRTVYNNKGTLDFVYDYWHYGDLKDIRELLKRHYGETDVDPVPDLPR